MIYTNLNHIRVQPPSVTGWEKLLRGLGKTDADDEFLGYDRILEINGPDDAFWCLCAEPQHERIWRAVAVQCVLPVRHLMTDSRSLDVLDVAERWSVGRATDAELAAVMDAAWISASAAARIAAGVAAGVAAWDARRAAAGAAAGDAAMKRAGEILLSAVSSYHAEPGELGVRE